MFSKHDIVHRQEVVDDALHRISKINLANVRLKLRYTGSGKDWDDATLDQTELEYRQFLALNFAYPDLTIVPDEAVDQFWHQHILDSRAYANDTTSVFGYFLHHFPYLGIRGPADAEKLAECYSETRNLYEVHFQTQEKERSTTGSSCGSGKCSSCASH